MKLESENPKYNYPKKEIEFEQNITTSIPEIKKTLLFEQLKKDIDYIIIQYFPNEFKNFNPPKLSKLYESFLTAITYLRSQNDTLTEKQFQDSVANITSLIPAMIIRYFDDFIDETLWPNINLYPYNILRKHFTKFLMSALQLAKEYEPNMPNEIIRLPLLEMNFELDATQENFDKNFLNFIEYKSFDIKYIHELFTGKKLPNNASTNESYILKSIIDIARDFNEGGEYAIDFNIYNYIKKNKLNPTLLINYLKSIKNNYDSIDDNLLDPEMTQILITINFMLPKLEDLLGIIKKKAQYVI